LGKQVDFRKSPEQELLLEAIKPGRDRDGRISVFLGRDLDWSSLIDTASTHGVLPLLYQRLAGIDSGRVDLAVTARLERAFQTNAYQNIRLSLRLIELLDILSAQEIRCLAIKGPALAVQAYGDLSMRQFCDVDVLIHPPDLVRVYDLLVTSGYTPEFSLTKQQLAYMLRSDKHLRFTRLADVIEVHWQINNPRIGSPLGTEDFWRAAAPVRVLDHEIFTFCPEVAIWSACLHGTQHGWSQLNWVADLAHLCQWSSQIDWPQLFDRAQRTGFHRLLCTSLLLAADPGGVVFPPEVQRHIQSCDRDQELARQFRIGLFDRQPDGIITTSSAYLRSRERIRDHARYWLMWLFTPSRSDWLPFRQPIPILPLLWLARPFRLVFVKGAPGLLRKKVNRSGADTAEG
jgi:hypothetical protein